jgi:hypothetical protein
VEFRRCWWSGRRVLSRAGEILAAGQRAAVKAQGFASYSEIEIFSDAWWGRPMDEVVATCIERHRTIV